MATTGSSRRATRLAALGGAAACAAALAPITAPPAEAARATGQQTYSCVITVDENPGEPGFVDLTASLQLDLPDQVSPGETFSVNGTFSVQLSGELGALFSAYFPTAQVISDGLTIPVSAGGQDMLIATSRLDSGNQSTSGQPMVLSAPVNSDPITVPADATGDVTMHMPRNDSVDAISRDGRAAFTATLVAQGGIVPGYEKGTDRVSCDATSGDPVAIGSVPIAARADEPAPAARPGEPQPQSANDAGRAAPAGGNAAPRSSAASSPRAAAPANALQKAQAESGGEQPAGPAAAAAGGAQDGAAATSSGTSLLASNQLAAEEDPGSGFFIPLEGLAWGTGIIVGACLIFSAWSNLRLRRLKELAEGTRAED